ncbi:hypothetical protein ONS95_009914 [Cadophora gregata]|uniref:uncharacterized protein n=1 Tax=Cadophora gregata TaxID=51156 RepID=UPI0026DC0C36|nr:uncharacterized protein ONS95_009914 [Cadophora gregata]KAK0121626.1 hypothetical protein ONS95_009914 [Cadophora gregata]KAK0127099.1 hypothetical protein ONS96_006658 [Cadophora gregata f. sp. sojae]
MADVCQFAWVNKNASNIASKDHITIANSHAQVVTWSQRRQLAANYSKRSTHKRLACCKSSPPAEQIKAINKARKQRPKPQVSVSAAVIPGNPACDSIFVEQLDPFISLAAKTTPHERNLLHYYLIVTPARVYGTHESSLFCPVRDRTLVFVQRCNDWLQGVILSAEVDILGSKAAEESMSVLSRRASIYRSIREELSNPETRYSDAAITRITTIAVAEHRIGCSPADAQRHLGIVKQLIVDRGDRWKRMPITIVSTFIWLGSGIAAFPDLDSLETATSSFARSMSSFCRQKSYRSELRREDSEHHQDQNLSRTYDQLLQQVFGPESSLSTFAQANFHDQIKTHYRSYLAIIWVLNRILYDLRDDMAKSIPFLRRLNNLIGTRGKTKPKGLTVLFIIMDCLARMGVPQHEMDNNASDMIICRGPGDHRIIWWWEAVDVVEIMLLMKEETRQHILEILSASLAARGSYGEMMKEAFLVDMMDGARRSWVAGRG